MTNEVTGKSGLGVQNEAGQRLTEFCQENSLVIADTLQKGYQKGYPLQYSQASLVAQAVKNLPALWETWV